MFFKRLHSCLVHGGVLRFNSVLNHIILNHIKCSNHGLLPWHNVVSVYFLYVTYIHTWKEVFFGNRECYKRPSLLGSNENLFNGLY